MEVIHTGSFDADHINTIIIDSANALTTFEEKKQREKIKKIRAKDSRKIRVGLNSLPCLFFMIE